MEPWVDIITKLGFPIACTLALGYVLYKLVKRWLEDSHEREESMATINEKFSAALAKVAETITESNNINRELSETNRTLVDKVESNLSELNNNVEKILDKLNTRED